MNAVPELAELDQIEQRDATGILQWALAKFGKSLAEPAVGRILQLGQAVRAGGAVGRHEGPAPVTRFARRD